MVELEERNGENVINWKKKIALEWVQWVFT